MNILHGEIRRRINSESMLLFHHKTTGNPTFQNAENDYVRQQNSNFSGCFMCVCVKYGVLLWKQNMNVCEQSAQENTCTYEGQSK
jgi:hypothetical protein